MKFLLKALLFSLWFVIYGSILAIIVGIATYFIQLFLGTIGLIAFLFLIILISGIIMAYEYK